MKKWGVVIFFLLCIKNEWAQFHWKNLLSKNRGMILNRPKNYYENDKERLREQTRNKNRSLSEEEKNKKREYGKNRYGIWNMETKTGRISEKLSWG